MASTASGQVQSDPRKLAGLLADERRLKVMAAVALGASTEAVLRITTGLDDAALAKALARLRAGGLVEGGSDGYRVRIEAFRAAARSERNPAPESGTLDAIVRNGRLPRSRPERLAALGQLADLFERGHRYPEAEVNARLSAVHADYALLRRYLVDERLLERASETAPGGHTVMTYWRSEPNASRS